MERQKTRTEIYDLSNDLMVEILSWLPLKSIARCLNVSKRWQSLIIDSQYLTNTIHVAAAMLNQQNRRNLCLEKGQRGRMQQVPELDFCIDFPNRSLYDRWVLSSCNGLLFSYFFNRGKGHECYISNPWTKECVSIPNPTLSCQYYDFFPPFLRGFAFENNSRAKNNVALYKIVMAFIAVQERNNYNYTYNYKFEMYSSEKKRWQLLEWVTQTHPSCHHRPHGICELEQNAVYCNRVLYWQCTREDHALMFNLETETSGYLDLPSDGGDTTAFGRRLMESDGLLHYIRIGIDSRLSVWKMSMMCDEWLVLHNVDLNKAVKRDLDSFSLYRGDIRNLKPIDMSCQGDDRVLFAYYSCPFLSYGRIVSYDLRRDVFELVFQKDFLSAWMFFRYTPTKMKISER